MLNFSVAANIAVHALVHLAGLGQSEPVSATAIADVIAVSPSHLSKVLQELARKGLVNSTRGAKGGFILAADPQKVTLLEVIRAVDPPPKPNGCLLGEQICHGTHCKLKALRENVSRMVEEELSSTSLAQFAPQSKEGLDETCYVSG
jgi:Rrf2 family protein